MRNRIRFESVGVIALASAAATLAFAVEIAGCGGDDATTPAEDASVDQTADVVPGEGGGPDARPDVADAGMDVAADVHVADVTIPPLNGFNAALAQTFCARLEQCCLVGSSSWDKTSCETEYSNPSFGGPLGIGYAAVAFDGGHVKYDTNLAGQCLTQLAQVPCGLVSTTQLNNIQALCLSAVPGTIDAGGAGCSSSFECVPVNYCALADGGTGTCVGLAGDGGACTSEDQCSYLANGPPQLYCSTTSHSCEVRLPADAGCGNSAECASNHCVFVSGRAQCIDKGVVSDNGDPGGICAHYTIQDAGGGG